MTAPHAGRSAILLSAIFALALLSSGTSQAAPGEKISYNRDIRPILSDNCFYCHGPDKSHRKAKLRLDVREEAIRLEAIVPGKPDDSLLVHRIFSKDPDELMPPPEAHKTLTAAQKDILKRWVEQGALYEPHWAYMPLQRPALPVVAKADWVRNPIDAFVLHELEQRKLTPSKEADRPALLRRLSLDLIGLPPTPQEIEAFVNDTSPNAYEKQVDRLLASPHYGERMAVGWLDAVRFADTVGYHGDQNQNVFPYRDYVINAFNNNKPFNQFTIEQLAGDLLPNPTTEQLVATGFNRLNMMTREGGAQPKEYLAKYQADRVRTVGTAFLGSTFGCAECHDHKFDPITARDFYSLSAYFADVKQWGVYHDYNYTPNPDLKGWSNDHPFPPEIIVKSPYLKMREGRLVEKMDQVAAEAGKKLSKDAKARAAFDAWRAQTKAFTRKYIDGWQPLNGPDSKRAIVFKAKPGADERVELTLPAMPLAAISLSVEPSEAGKTLARDGGKSANVQLTLALKSANGGKETRLAVWYADALLKEHRYGSGHRLLGLPPTGWRTSSEHATGAQTAVYLLDRPIVAAEGDVLVLTFAKNTLAKAEVDVTPVGPLSPTYGLPEINALHQLAGDVPGEAAVWRSYLLNTTADLAAQKQLREIQKEIFECRDGRSPTLVTQALDKPFVTRILPRGNWQDDSGEIVPPATPGFLPATPRADGKRQTRLDLANWLVSPQNPLTSRVFVNRTWKQLFGSGLSNSIEDVGAQGEAPSHPELLDWLSAEFREPTTGQVQGQRQPWDVKHLVRLIVTSSAYRQMSDIQPALRDSDPQNRLLASQSPRRLEAEFVRDNALFAAGLITLDIGGPSVKPYQPADYYAPLQFPNRPYVPEADERQWRRGLYVHWQRTFLHPMMANFDGPSREDTICTRTVSNTPQQALTLLNDPTFVEAARVLAQNVISSHKDDNARLDAIYRKALGRSPRDREVQSLARFLAGQRAHFKANPADAEKLRGIGIFPKLMSVDVSELAAWTSVSRVVLNLHETITRY